MEGRCENNSVNRMTEHLQAICPVPGCPPWRYEEGSGTGGWRVRIVLEQTGLHGDQDRLYPWSPPHAKKMGAKKAAARLCLESLLDSGDRPHDPSHITLAVGLTHQVAGTGAGSLPVATIHQGTAPPAVLPTLSAGLLAVSAVECTARAAGLASAAAEATGRDSDSGDSSGDDNDAMGAGPPCDTSAAAQDAHAAQLARQQALSGGHVPPNLGRLGEEYAVRWFQHHGYTVRWLNDADEQQGDHDLETTMDGGALRFVEVKTRWKGSKPTMSPRQRARLLDPDDNYTLCIIGNARRLFDTPASRPSVRVVTFQSSEEPGNEYVPTTGAMVTPDMCRGDRSGGATGSDSELEPEPEHEPEQELEPEPERAKTKTEVAPSKPFLGEEGWVWRSVTRAQSRLAQSRLAQSRAQSRLALAKLLHVRLGAKAPTARWVDADVLGKVGWICLHRRCSWSIKFLKAYAAGCTSQPSDSYLTRVEDLGLGLVVLDARQVDLENEPEPEPEPVPVATLAASATKTPRKFYIARVSGGSWSRPMLVGEFAIPPRFSKFKQEAVFENLKIKKKREQKSLRLFLTATGTMLDSDNWADLVNRPVEIEGQRMSTVHVSALTEDGAECFGSVSEAIRLEEAAGTADGQHWASLRVDTYVYLSLRLGVSASIIYLLIRAVY
jgi:hypothetical protein